jgi:DNA-binding MarR family transcriptional regulator
VPAVSSMGDRDELGVGLGRLQRLLSSRRVYTLHAQAAKVDLSQQAAQVLRALADTPAQPVADVARAARMDVGAVSRQLRSLEEGGLVARNSSPSHGSVVLVEATPEGVATASRFEQTQTRHMAEALADWTPDERALLGTMLLRLVDDLQNTPYRTGDAGTAA